jgi:hypothetical protein
VTHLSVQQGFINGDRPVSLSCWKLNKEEFAEVQKTCRIWVLIMGEQMPPVTIQGMRPELADEPNPQ